MYGKNFRFFLYENAESTSKTKLFQFIEKNMGGIKLNFTFNREEVKYTVMVKFFWRKGPILPFN